MSFIEFVKKHKYVNSNILVAKCGDSYIINKYIKYYVVDICKTDVEKIKTLLETFNIHLLAEYNNNLMCNQTPQYYYLLYDNDYNYWLNPKWFRYWKNGNSIDGLITNNNKFGKYKIFKGDMFQKLRNSTLIDNKLLMSDIAYEILIRTNDIIQFLSHIMYSFTVEYDQKFQISLDRDNFEVINYNLNSKTIDLSFSVLLKKNLFIRYTMYKKTLVGKYHITLGSLTVLEGFELDTDFVSKINKIEELSNNINQMEKILLQKKIEKKKILSIFPKRKDIFGYKKINNTYLSELQNKINEIFPTFKKTPLHMSIIKFKDYKRATRDYKIYKLHYNNFEEEDVRLKQKKEYIDCHLINKDEHEDEDENEDDTLSKYFEDTETVHPTRICVSYFPDTFEFKKNQKVEHDKNGYGTIVEVNDTKLTVNFPNYNNTPFPDNILFLFVNDCSAARKILFDEERIISHLFSKYVSKKKVPRKVPQKVPQVSFARDFP